MANHDQPGFLYAVSWEVCNRVGGVHTVLETSAPYLGASYGDDLLYVGPDLWANRAVRAAFEEDPSQPLVAALAAERDIPVRFGRWKVEGNPAVALVDCGRLLESKHRIFGDLWKNFGVDSIRADWDTVERILFGYAAGMLIELHYHAGVRPRALRAVSHFHQWLSGAGLLRLTQSTPEIGSVYTPHGTALGRTLASAGVPLHLELDSVEPEQSALERGIQAQHTLEVAAAKQASVLACVSEHSAAEAAHILGRRPEIIIPNGFQPRRRPDPKHREEVRASLFRCAERFLGSPVDPESTRLVFSSGPYQFHNKGFDVTLEALGRVRGREPRPQRPLLSLIAVPAAQTGPRPVVIRRLKGKDLAGAPCGVCTHNLAHPKQDPVLAACDEAGIANHPDDAVRLLFVPVMLDGRDPVLPFSYTDILQASDLSLFPSLYEPWGYTPVESLAAGVPTVTTDLTGFGRFVLTLPEEERSAVTVLRSNGALAESLEEVLLRFLESSPDELAAVRRAGDELVRRTSWEKLIGKTLESHALALDRAGSRRAATTAPGLSRLSRRSVVVFPARGLTQPHLQRFTVEAAPPDRLQRLEELAHNLWWSWNPQGRALFERLDAEAFEASGFNPVRLLLSLQPSQLAAAAEDDEFVRMYDAVLTDFDAYRNRPRADLPETAYYCAEFGIHESLPIYSGGLGILAGDHLKSASDMQLPLTGVGLAYANGYFVQRIRPDGSQGVESRAVEPRETPLVEVCGDDDRPMRISIEMPERELTAGAWRVDVGSVELFLLDTLVEENDPADQGITERLYPSDRESRLRQEILLGMGGWRLLKALGKVPQVCHLNEGHSAFLLLERLLDLVEEQGLTYEEAECVVRASTTFTTHTPVPAGHDRFSEGLMRRYFGHVAQRLGLSWDEFLDLGRTSGDEHEFSMTTLALRLSGRANGVSRLHGEVSRNMLAKTWPGFHEGETPVDSITNGVHLGTWVGPEIEELLAAQLSPDWTRNHPAPELWAKAQELPDEVLWSARAAQKKRMIAFLRERIGETGLRRGLSPAAMRRRMEGITEDALWIGYARRFAPYKRATLLFRDAERLARILTSEKRPVRIVFAGKSHPDDREGADLVREIVRQTGEADFEGRVFFAEDYGIAAARMLVQGVDVWLNTPTRPLEASGTSGMKAALNGALHLSVLDGWWCEGYDGENGWAIGEGREYDSPELQAEHDSRSLYGLLETEILPLYFARDAQGLPVGWLKRVKHALATVPRQFTTHRMVADYVHLAYAPLGEQARALSAEEFAGARSKAERLAHLREAWQEVRIEDVSVTDLTRGSIGIGEVFEARARVHLGSLPPDDLAVELYVGPVDPAGKLREPVVIQLLPDGEAEDGGALFSGAYLPSGAGTFRYGVRVRPAMDTFEDAAHLGLVCWA